MSERKERQAAPAATWRPRWAPSLSFLCEPKGMHPMVAEKRAEIEELCRRFRVSRLELFGSATGTKFDPNRSDLDFLVRFAESDPLRYGRAYFGLLESLEGLFGRRVDLVSDKPFENPYFQRTVDETRTLLYAG
ncbi:MAG: nucleotidyltransferase family protein [Terriglobales bacterium]